MTKEQVRFVLPLQGAPLLHLKNLVPGTAVKVTATPLLMTRTQSEVFSLELLQFSRAVFIVWDAKLEAEFRGKVLEKTYSVAAPVPVPIVTFNLYPVKKLT